MKKGLLEFLQSASNSVAGNVAGPVDLISLGLNKLGVNVGVPVGGSEWMKNKGLMANVPQGSARVLGETAGLLGPAMATQFAPQIARGLLSLDDKAMDMGRQAIEKQLVRSGGIQPATVWHGSPHKFDKFDSSKIGTGEGNQVYGHGLYFAESPEVAKGYADNLSMRSSGKTVAELKAELQNIKATMQGPLRSNAMRENAAQMEMAKRSQGSQPSVYKVDLPDDQIAKMLDWDKPLSQQPQGAQAALAKLDPDMYHPTGGDYDPTELGQMIYQRLAQKGQDAAATSMRGAGIPGIRYLDGGSRGAGSGSSNFVVFPGNEGLLSILERNGKAIK